MKKFRVCDDDEKGQFEVHSITEIEAKTQAFIAKAITVTVVTLLIFTAACVAFLGKNPDLSAITTSATTLMGVLVGHYFKGSG
jgi:hypothetical protein